MDAINSVGNGSILSCPRCGGANLHQQDVEIWNRLEDADRGMHATVNFSSVSMDSDMSENPSARRDGLVISFYCENCEENFSPKLAIIQHKGITEVEWLNVTQES